MGPEEGRLVAKQEEDAVGQALSLPPPAEAFGSHQMGGLGFMELFSDDLGSFGAEGALDSATLEAVCQVAGSSGSRQPATGCPTGKRVLEEANLSDSDDEEEGRCEKAAGKRAKGEVSAAASKKAHREKARREKLNERFVDLARLIDPGNEPKTDKSNILTDAIKFVQQITVENNQLKQLNKFLEERVSTLERERGQQLYQHSLMLQGMGQGQLMQAGQPMIVGGPAGMPHMAGMPMGQMGMPAAAMAAAAAAAAAAGGPGMMAAGGPGLPGAPTPPLPLQAQGSQGGPSQAQALAMHASGAAGLLAQGPGGMLATMQLPGAAGVGMGAMGVGPAAAYGHMGPGGAAGAGPSKPAGVMVNAAAVTAAGGAGGVVMQYPGMTYWLPPQMMDSTQDSLLRPPAA